jgi:ABC-type nitrate/sulfonate/bicarbonate transport system permease component
MFKRLVFPYMGGNFQTVALMTLAQAVLFIAIWSVVPIAGLSTPAEITVSLGEMITKHGLIRELLISVMVILKSIFYSSVISLALGYLATAIIFRPAASLVSSFRFLGFAGITFLFTLWTSSGMELKIWLLTFGMTVFLTTTIIAEVKALPKDQVDYARTLGLKGWGITYEMVVLGKLDVMIDLIRQNAAIGWVMLSMVEGLVRSDGGIGTLLINQNKYFHLSSVFAIQGVILMYGIGQDYAFRWLRGFVCPYSKLNKE